MLITLDFETYYKSGKNGFSLRHLPYLDYVTDPRFRVIMCGIKIDDQKTEIFTGDGGALRTKLHKLFCFGNTHTLLCHNTMFDALILAKHYGVHPWRYADTLSMFKALANYCKSSLEVMALSLFPNNENMRKTKEIVDFDGLRLEDFTEIDIETYASYCRNDVELTYACYQRMLDFFPKPELDVIDQTIRLYTEPVLMIDTDLVKDSIKQVEDEKQRLREAAKQEHGIDQTVLASNQQFAAWLQERNIEPPIKTSPANGKKTWALAKNDLGFIALQQKYPDYRTVWEARISEKSTAEITRCNRFLHNADLDDSQMRVPLIYHGTHTGRYSGSQSLNLQNLGRNSPLRRSLIAQPDEMIYVADLSQIEARINAWFSGQFDLLEAFREGRDVYSEFASRLFGYPVSKSTPTERLVGKVSILGLGYQMSAERFSNTLATGALGPPVHLDKRTAKQYVNTYRTSYSAITRNWEIAQNRIFSMCSSECDMQWKALRVLHNRIQLPNGLFLNYPNLDYTSDERTGQLEFSYWNGKHVTNLYGGKLCENIIQALAFVLIKEQLMAVIKEMPQMRYALQVHDENIFVGPDRGDEANKALMDQILAIMSRSPKWAPTLPVAAEGGFAKNYADAK